MVKYINRSILQSTDRQSSKYLLTFFTSSDNGMASNSAAKNEIASSSAAKRGAPILSTEHFFSLLAAMLTDSDLSVYIVLAIGGQMLGQRSSAPKAALARETAKHSEKNIPVLLSDSDKVKQPQSSTVSNQRCALESKKVLKPVTEPSDRNEYSSIDAQKSFGSSSSYSGTLTSSMIINNYTYNINCHYHNNDKRES